MKTTELFSGNPIVQLLGIKYPIFQGGMAWVSDAVLAAAVSNAGGLGLIAAGGMTGEQLRDEIIKAKTLTVKPFGVNIMLMSPYAGEVAKVVIEEKIPVVTTGAGSPAKYMEGWAAHGIKVIPVVPSVAYARMMEKAGAAAVVAEGQEAGGHIGELTTVCLVPQVADNVGIPVLSAGGIADGRGIAAAFMLGACGVQVGTRFLTAKECTIHANYKAQVLAANDIQTVVTGRRLGHPVRALKSNLTRSYAKLEYDPGVDSDALEAMTAGALRKAAVDGDVQNGCFMAGQIAGLVKDELTAREIIERMFSEAAAILRDAAHCLT